VEVPADVLVGVGAAEEAGGVPTGALVAGRALVVLEDVDADWVPHPLSTTIKVARDTVSLFIPFGRIPSPYGSLPGVRVRAGC
jgi:hypothetical protein